MRIAAAASACLLLSALARADDFTDLQKLDFGAIKQKAKTMAAPPPAVGVPYDPMSTPGGPVGERASDKYRASFFKVVKARIFADTIVDDSRPCSRLGSILYFINEEIPYVDRETGGEKKAPAVKMDKDGLEKKIDDMAPDIDLFFVENSYRMCLRAHGGGVPEAAAIYSSMKKDLSNPANGDCRRVVGDAKDSGKDAVLIFNPLGKELDDTGAVATPATSLNAGAAHEMLHLVLAKIKTKDAKAHHGLTDWLHWGAAKPVNTISFSVPSTDCRKYLP